MKTKSTVLLFICIVVCVMFLSYNDSVLENYESKSNTINLIQTILVFILTFLMILGLIFDSGGYSSSNSIKKQ